MKNELELLISDITRAAENWRFWVFLAWSDVARQYRRSVIGPLWIVISSMVFVIAFGIIGSRLFNLSTAIYIPYLAIGNLIFIYLSAVANEGCFSYIAAEAFLKQVPYPRLVFPLRVVARNIILFAHGAVVVIGVLFYFGSASNIRYGAVILGIICLVVFGILIASILGLIAARFRDIPLLVTNLVQILFFVTPILWRPEQIDPNIAKWIYYNPLFLLIDVVRAPLLGGVFVHWAILGTQLGVLVSGFFIIYLLWRKRISYWI